jgi:hypothetical protein
MDWKEESGSGLDRGQFILGAQGVETLFLIRLTYPSPAIQRHVILTKLRIFCGSKKALGTLVLTVLFS